MDDFPSFVQQDRGVHESQWRWPTPPGLQFPRRTCLDYLLSNGVAWRVMWLFGPECLRPWTGREGRVAKCPREHEAGGSRIPISAAAMLGVVVFS